MLRESTGAFSSVARTSHWRRDTLLQLLRHTLNDVLDGAFNDDDLKCNPFETKGVFDQLFKSRQPLDNVPDTDVAETAFQAMNRTPKTLEILLQNSTMDIAELQRHGPFHNLNQFTNLSGVVVAGFGKVIPLQRELATSLQQARTLQSVQKPDELRQFPQGTAV